LVQRLGNQEQTLKDTYLKLGLCNRWISGQQFGPGQYTTCLCTTVNIYFHIFHLKWKRIQIIITIFDWYQNWIGAMVIVT
jgi:hypothetical protein